MPRPLYLKVFYQLRNTYQATVDTILQRTTGLLAHIDDVRDHLFAGTSGYVPKYTEKSNLIFEERFNQYPHNFCVLAAATQASSHQNGIKFSERYTAKMARHFGYTSLDGLSYLRAAKEIEVKYGLLPEEYMSGRVDGMSWEEYSKWTPEDEKLLDIAAQFRSSEYKRVTSLSAVHELLDMGRLLSTGSPWYQGMNSVYGPDFVLRATGLKVGAHAFTICGYGKRNMLNTFSSTWGDNGTAYDPGFFEKNDYAIYTIESLPVESHWFYIMKTLNGKAVKGRQSPHIYYIFDGKKYHIEDWETFTKNFNSFTPVLDAGLDLVPSGGVYQP